MLTAFKTHELLWNLENIFKDSLRNFYEFKTFIIFLRRTFNLFFSSNARATFLLLIKNFSIKLNEKKKTLNLLPGEKIQTQKYD